MKAEGERDLARLFKALSDETRLKIIRMLSEQDYSVGDLAEALQMPIARISHHLGILRTVSMVSDRRQGKQIIYGLSGVEELALQGQLGWLKSGADVTTLLNRLLWKEPETQRKKGTLTVFAASSLLYAFEAIGFQFKKRTGIEVCFRFGSSGELAHQIERGAEVDLFASASSEVLNNVNALGRLRSGTVHPFAKAWLALWQREGHRARIERLEDLLESQVRWIVIANPNQAPSGELASKVLKNAGLWGNLTSKILLSNDAAQARTFADTDNGGVALAPLTVTASAQGRSTLLPEFQEFPLEYSIALTHGASPQAEDFVHFLLEGPGKVLLRQYGFSK